MIGITNTNDIDLGLAVWLVHDEYDYVNEPNYISATSLMKPIRQLLLPALVPPTARVMPDVEDYISRALGHSLHDSIEKAWIKGYAKNLKKLGYPDSLIERVKINPEDKDLTPETIPIYLEQRAIREHRSYRIGGKFDMVKEGIVHDNKSTSAYSWVFGGKDDDYALQGSIYRWLNPKKITEDIIRINFIFTDWQRAQAKSNPNYPQRRVESREIPLLSMKQTEEWIDWKLNQIEKYKGAPENQIPECTDAELWMSDPAFKYYADPNKTDGRSTKNFTTIHEANQFKTEKGKGIVITVPAQPKRCGYCDSFSICSQKDKYKHD